MMQDRWLPLHVDHHAVEWAPLGEVLVPTDRLHDLVGGDRDPPLVDRGRGKPSAGRLSFDRQQPLPDSDQPQ
jgi:hypothetical protein